MDGVKDAKQWVKLSVVANYMFTALRARFRIKENASVSFWKQDKVILELQNPKGNLDVKKFGNMSSSCQFPLQELLENTDRKVV